MAWDLIVLSMQWFFDAHALNLQVKLQRRNHIAGSTVAFIWRMVALHQECT